MAIKTEEIKKLVDLARIEVSEEELLSLSGEIESILGYVAQVQNTVGDNDLVLGKNNNVFREDKPRETTESDGVIDAFPNKQGNYLKVKKIF